MIYTAVNMAMPSHEDRYIPLSCTELESERAEHNAEITVNLQGTQLVCFLTDSATGEPIGKALGWPGDTTDNEEREHADSKD